MNNKEVESKRIDYLCKHINEETELGQHLKDDYNRMFNKQIKSVSKKGGNKDHYDIEICHSDNTISRCEEKGTKKNIKFNKLQTPWKQSVQRFNGPGNKFTIGIQYAKLWYDLVVTSDICKSYHVESNPPTLDEWLKKDAFQCGNPKTLWGIENKSKYRECFGKTSMNGTKKSPNDIRKIVNPVFIEHIKEEDKDVLKKEVQTILDSIMNEKDCWLQTAGTIENNNLKFKWSEKIKSPTLLDVKITWEKDIYFSFITDEEAYNFRCILRFGKGTGFSNIRLDIR